MISHGDSAVYSTNHEEVNMTVETIRHEHTVQPTAKELADYQAFIGKPIHKYFVVASLFNSKYSYDIYATSPKQAGFHILEYMKQHPAAEELKEIPPKIISVTLAND